MRNFFKNLIQFMLISYLVLTLFRGITLPESFHYYIATLIVFSIAMFMSSPLLGFLTVKENFLTTFVMTSLISVGFLFLLNTFMPGVYIDTYVFEGMDLGSLVINSFDVTPILTIIFVSVTASLVASLLTVLEKSS
jgi:hypothetical protein